MAPGVFIGLVTDEGDDASTRARSTRARRRPFVLRPRPTHARGRQRCLEKEHTMKSRVLPAKIAIVATAAATAAGIIGMVTPAHAQAQITRVWTEHARDLPNQSVDVTAQVTGASHVRFRLMHLGEQVMASDDRPVDGYGRASWEFSAPDRDYTGYVIEADSDNGAQGETALDVSSDPYRYLRFGFLDSYPQGMSGADQQRAVDDLAQK